MESHSQHPRPIKAIARDIQVNWGNVHYTAKPYLDALRTLNTGDDTWGDDHAHTLIRYFLANAGTYRGGLARDLKKELAQWLNL